jgi:hypothetical protein
VHVPVERTPQRAILWAVIGLVFANGALFLAVRQSPWIGLGITILSLVVCALVARAASRRSAPAARTGLRRYVAVGAVVAVAVAIPSTFIIGAAADAFGVPLAAILFFGLPLSQAAVQHAILRRRVGQLAVSLSGVFYFTCMTGIFLTALIAYA